MEPVQSAATSLASHGILGAICVILLGAILALYRELQKVSKDRTEQVEAIQRLRIDDAAKYQSTLLDMLKVATAAVTQSTASQEAMETALKELREAFDKFAERTRGIR